MLDLSAHQHHIIITSLRCQDFESIQSESFVYSEAHEFGWSRSPERLPVIVSYSEATNGGIDGFRRNMDGGFHTTGNPRWDIKCCTLEDVLRWCLRIRSNLFLKSQLLSPKFKTLFQKCNLLFFFFLTPMCPLYSWSICLNKRSGDIFSKMSLAYLQDCNATGYSVKGILLSFLLLILQQ